ncbi:MAG: prepilin-type N-terminal cleavage/methylation domain-containing protein [Kofleriaceae bacterium]
MPRKDEDGFTLIEVVVVIAIVGILAMVAIPAFFSESSKVKAESEVSPLFADIHVRQEQFKLENGSYVTAPMWPPTPNRKGQAWNQSGLPTAWTDTLKLVPQTTNVRCSYTTAGGLPGDTADLSAIAPGIPATLTFTAPATKAWYVAIARCDMDGSTAVDSWFLSSSVDTTMQRANPGK